MTANEVNKVLGLRGREGGKIHLFVNCFFYATRCCMYGLFFCGDFLFDDDHYLSKVIVRKQSLTCKSQIDKGYYNNRERRLKVKDICVQCGEMGAESCLLGLH